MGPLSGEGGGGSLFPRGDAGSIRWCCVELGGAQEGSKEEPNLDRNLMKKRQGRREAVA